MELYMHLEQDKAQCFHFEKPEGITVNLNYVFPSSRPGRAVEIFIVEDDRQGPPTSQGKKLLSKQVDNPRGSFEFTVPADGAYRACISQVKQKTGPLVQKSKPWRFGLDLVYGHNDAYYDQLQERLKIGELEVMLLKLQDRALDILREADFMKVKEVDFHLKSESMNSAALWWPMIQVAVLLVFGVMHVRHLKAFFKGKKLI